MKTLRFKTLPSWMVESVLERLICSSRGSRRGRCSNGKWESLSSKRVLSAQRRERLVFEGLSHLPKNPLSKSKTSPTVRVLKMQLLHFLNYKCMVIRSSNLNLRR